MTNQLINAAAFTAALATVVFDRLILPTLDITYRYVMQELGQEPQLATAIAMPVAAAPVTTGGSAKPAPKRRTTRKKTTVTKPAAGTGF